jgi:hypothetical protein
VLHCGLQHIAGLISFKQCLVFFWGKWCVPEVLCACSCTHAASLFLIVLQVCHAICAFLCFLCFV